jgi:hypothetical protein
MLLRGVELPRFRRVHVASCKLCCHLRTCDGTLRKISVALDAAKDLTMVYSRVTKTKRQTCTRTTTLHKSGTQGMNTDIYLFAHGAISISNSRIPAYLLSNKGYEATATPRDESAKTLGFDKVDTKAFVG